MDAEFNVERFGLKDDGDRWGVDGRRS